MAKKNIHEQRIKTNSEYVDICYKQTKGKDGLISLEMSAVYSEKYATDFPDEGITSSTQIEFIRKKTVDIASKEQIPKAVNNYGGIAARIFFEKRILSDSTTSSCGRMRSAFEKLVEENDGITPTWTTGVRSRMYYFRKHVLPFLEKFENPKVGKTFYDSDRKELFDKLTAIAFAREITGKTKDINISKAGAAKHMYESNLIYQRIRAKDAETHDTALPNIDLTIRDEKIYRVQSEQQKFLSEKMRKAFAFSLEKDISAFPELVFAATAMRNGARTSEAAALNPFSLEFKDEYATMQIDNQNYDGVRRNTKSSDSYRKIALDSYSRFIFEKCTRVIMSTHPDLTADDLITNSKTVSEYVKRKLIEAGAGAVLNAVETELYSFDANVKISDSLNPEAYLLRRDYATVLKFICGFDPDTIDRYLGHKTAKKKLSRNYNSEQKLIEDSRKLDRHCLRPEISRYSNVLEADIERCTLSEETVIIRNNGLMDQTLKISVMAYCPNSAVRYISDNPGRFSIFTLGSEANDWQKKKRNLIISNREY